MHLFSEVHQRVLASSLTGEVAVAQRCGTRLALTPEAAQQEACAVEGVGTQALVQARKLLAHKLGRADSGPLVELDVGDVEPLPEEARQNDLCEFVQALATSLRSRLPRGSRFHVDSHTTSQQVWIQERLTDGSVRLAREQRRRWAVSVDLLVANRGVLSWLERSMAGVGALDLAHASRDLPTRLLSCEFPSNSLVSLVVPGGRKSVLMVGQAANMFFHEVGGHGLIDGTATGCRALSEAGVSIADDPVSNPCLFGSQSIDDGGSPMRAHTLPVDDGRWRGALRREDFRFPAYPRATNTIVPAGQSSVGQLQEQVWHGVQVEKALEGWFDASTGEWCLVAMEAYAVVYGVRHHTLLEPFALQGRLDDAVQVIGIGKERDAWGFYCGAKSGSVPVGTRCPAIALSGVQLVALDRRQRQSIKAQRQQAEAKCHA